MDDSGEILEVVFLSEVVAESFKAVANVIDDAGFLNHGEGGAEPADVGVGIDRWAIDMDESELGSILTGNLGGAVRGADGVVRKIDTGYDGVKGFVLIFADKKNLDRSLANTLGGEGSDGVGHDCSESTRSEDESFRIMFFDEFEGFEEGVSDIYEGLDIMGSANDVTDEGFDFLVSELKNAILIIGLMRLEIGEDVLIKDVVADE